MAATEQQAGNYLTFAYEAVDANPAKDFARREVESRLGIDEDAARQVLRDLESRGLLRHQGGDDYRLTLPAIHMVEEQRLEEGRDDLVDPLREQRGDYVRAVHRLTDGAPGEAVNVSEILDELEMEPAVETRTRAYLEAADLIEEVDDKEVALTPVGREWAEGS